MQFLDINGVKRFKQYTDDTFITSEDVSTVEEATLDNFYTKSEIDALLENIETGGTITETDPTVPAWAKAANKPTYTAAEVGTLPSTTSIPTESTVAGWGFTKNAGTLTSETDPVFTASAAHGISSTDISNWNAKQKAITISSSEPTSSDGNNGDIWIVI